MPVACQQCVGALAAFKKTQTYGRGFSSKNEVFS
jgi:hypothetical protein